MDLQFATISRALDFAASHFAPQKQPTQSAQASKQTKNSTPESDVSERGNLAAKGKSVREQDLESDFLYATSSSHPRNLDGLGHLSAIKSACSPGVRLCREDSVENPGSKLEVECSDHDSESKCWARAPTVSSGHEKAGTGSTHPSLSAIQLTADPANASQKVILDAWTVQATADIPSKQEQQSLLSSESMKSLEVKAASPPYCTLPIISPLGPAVGSEPCDNLTDGSFAEGSRAESDDQVSRAVAAASLVFQVEHRKIV